MIKYKTYKSLQMIRFSPSSNCVRVYTDNGTNANSRVILNLLPQFYQIFYDMLVAIYSENILSC